MKIVKKLDDSNRICIGAEIRDLLGWKRFDEIEVETVGNEIILRKLENTPKLNVDTQKKPKEPTLIRDENTRIPSIETYFKINSKLDLLDTKDKLNDTLCPKCRKPIENSRFKLDGKYICRDCRNKLKNKLYFEILNKKEKL